MTEPRWKIIIYSLILLAWIAAVPLLARWLEDHGVSFQ